MEDIISLPVREAIGRFKYIKEEDVDTSYEKIDNDLTRELNDAIARKEEY